MQERRRIFKQWRQGGVDALVSLVRVEGSSYRRPGARMLVGADGNSAGAISGGCLEAEVARKAVWSVRNGAVLERFSTLFDDVAEIPYGLGCGGIVDLLLEPARSPECVALLEAIGASLQGETRHVVTYLPEQNLPLRRRVTDASGRLLYSSDGLAEGQPFASPLAAPRLFFEEWLEAPQRLWLFGAGDDAQPVVQMAAFLGWNVTVVDGRDSMARPERFPQAERVIPASSQEGRLPAGIVIAERDAVVIMSHSYEQDRAWLTAVLPRAPRYLGLLGARHRSALLVSEAAAALDWAVERVCAGIFAPVGLDLGGDGAEAIALAVIAEIQACCEGKLGVSRRLSAQAVTELLPQGDASRYLQTQCAV